MDDEMTVTRKFPHLGAAFGADALEWLEDNAPRYADALIREVQSGASAADIRAYARQETDGHRGPFVTRLRQAADYLIAQREAA